MGRRSFDAVANRASIEIHDKGIGLFAKSSHRLLCDRNKAEGVANGITLHSMLISAKGTALGP